MRPILAARPHVPPLLLRSRRFLRVKDRLGTDLEAFLFLQASKVNAMDEARQYSSLIGMPPI
jgi:hypothetical protein